MDWKKLQSDAKTWTDKAMIVAGQTIETGKEYVTKAKVQSYDALVGGEMTGLKDLTSFEKIHDTKRLAIFCIWKDAPITSRILLLFPIVFSKAWIESGTVKVMEYSASEELRNTLDITEAPTVLIYESGECKKRLEDPEEIISFMKDFTFYVEAFPEEFRDIINKSMD